MNPSQLKSRAVITFGIFAVLKTASPSARAEITYLDATHGADGNTYATGGSPAVTGWLDATSNSASANPSQWVLRTPLGTNGSIYQAFHNGNEMPELTTEISGLADGDYDVWVFFWDGPNANRWTISAGLESGSLTTYSFDGAGNTTAPVAASTLSFSGTPPMTTEDPRILYGVKIGQSSVEGGTAIRVYLNNLVGGGSAERTWYDGVGHAPASSPPPPPPPPAPAPLGPPLVGIDFNRTDVFGSPSQSFFRIVGGSATQTDNSPSYIKSFGPRQVTVTRPDGEKFEFRGGNGDGSRAIPGGETSLSFLVADFIATRKGAIDLEFAGLAAGDYIFRSWHLDTFTSGNLGFAQGATTTTPNTIEARIGGDLMGSVQGTSLGTSGLANTFINDTQIPRLEFEFSHDGSSPLVLELRSTLSNGTDNFLLLNGFAIYPKTP